jgi:hypothetical protein
VPDRAARAAQRQIVPARHERYLGEYQLFLEANQRLQPWFDKI